MRFTPHTAPLKFQSARQTDAFAWLEAAQPKEPFAARLEAYPLAGPPDPGRLSKWNARPDRGEMASLAPRGRCPTSGRTLSLLVFRDLSAVILRESAAPQGGLEALPASLGLPSELFDIACKSLPHDARQGVPRIRLLAGPPDLLWQAERCEVGAAAVDGIFRLAIEQAAAVILAAGPVVDPRVHEMLPGGVRYAAHSRWPRVERTDADIARLERAIRALAALRARRTGQDYAQIRIARQTPVTPWLARSSQAVAISRRRAGGLSAGRDKTFDKVLRALLDSPAIGLRDSRRFGPEGDLLLALGDCPAPETAHAALTARRVVAELAADLDLAAATG